METITEEENITKEETKYMNLLSRFFEENVFSYAGELVDRLFELQEVNCEDIKNFYPIKEEDEEKEEEDEEKEKEDEEEEDEYDDEEYYNTPQEVGQWFIVSYKGYKKFKQCGFPVFKYKELYFWGRLAYGLSFECEFIQQPKFRKCIIGY